jgi:hypothetical protein
MDVINKLFTASSEQVRRCMHQHVEFMIECAYYSPRMLGFSASTIALAACAHSAEVLRMPDACLSFIPDIMWTNDVMEAKVVLSRCINRLRYEEGTDVENSDITGDAGIDEQDSAEDDDDVDLVSPTNVTDPALLMFGSGLGGGGGC